MDNKNDYFDKNRLVDIVGEITIEHDEDEDADRHLIDMALQSSQQSEANNRTKYTTTNSQHNSTDTIENMDPTFLNVFDLYLPSTPSCLNLHNSSY